jgi:dihydropyrimidinase
MGGLPAMRTLITNGTIVTAEGSYPADVLVDGERIVGIGAGLADMANADETIDAAGRYVIPGGIDVHTHMELPFGGTFAKDTFETGTRAAAHGGTTTIVDFAVQSRGASLREGLDAWHAKAEGNAVADYGFHMIMSDVNDDTLREMDQLVAEGVPDFKLFTAYPGVFFSDDGAIFRAMKQTAKNGGLIMMHAENGLAIDVIAAETFEAGTTDPIGHGLARYSVLEGEATNRVIRLAQAANVPVYIVHLSAREALNAVRQARDEGLPALAETCPQYLFLSLDDLGNGFEGAKFVCSPPLRTPDHADELWRGLVKDDLQVVSTDHCPFDFHGQKDLGRGDFRKVPNGLPGVEDRVDLLHDGGVVAGRISRERWVEIISTAPAKLFGMYPHKGAIAIGSDADIVIYDPDRKRTISATTHHMDVDYSCYEGRQVQGAADIVMSRGSVIVRDGQFTGRKGHGRFVKRATADFARMA